MAANHSAEQPPQASRKFAERAKRAGLFILFGTLLVIPRIRRLRRRVWAWSFVRLGVAAGATWLGWRYKDAGAGPASLALSLLLFAFALLVRAKPEEKSVDVLARELNALVVLNGGTFLASADSIPSGDAQILVRPEQIIIVGAQEHTLLGIPFAQVRNLSVHAAANKAGTAEEWVVEISWFDDAPRTTTFHYDGSFAEHLARVTESTLRSQWSKGLPVIPS